MPFRHRWKVVFIYLFGFLLTTSASVWSGTSDLSQIMLQAHRSGEPTPVVSRVDSTLTIEQAYAIQSVLVQAQRESLAVSGFKAGLTTVASQQRFGLDQPVAGVLLSSGYSQPDVSLLEFKRPMIEVEIALIVSRAITDSLPDVAALKAHVDQVAPAIELPDLDFAEMAGLTGVDIVAANVSASHFIVGDPKNASAIDLQSIAATLERDGDPLLSGRGSDVMGDPWQAGLWLVNAMIAQGWTIEAGQVLLTGAMSPMIPAAAGEYRADYGPLGHMTFFVK